MDIYPSYDQIKIAKHKCYPDNIEVNEYSASVPLQELVNHTAKRLLESLNLGPNDFDDVSNLYLHFKWGCDGSSGHSEYHQKYSATPVDDQEKIDSDCEMDIENMHINEMNKNNKCDWNLFLFSLVPSKLNSIKTNNIISCIWENQKPPSTRYCRLIKFIFEKETVSTTKREVDKIKKEINKLKPFEISNSLKANFYFYLFMVNGKVINTLSSSSSQTCNICKCTPINMNNMYRKNK